MPQSGVSGGDGLEKSRCGSNRNVRAWRGVLLFSDGGEACPDPLGAFKVFPVLLFGSELAAEDFCLDRSLGAMLTSVLVVSSSAFPVDGSSETTVPRSEHL